ncbi:MAG TPA: polyphosphate kinase 1, partial [Candidatus Sulfotelmatobacter sp.]|nr:polyphosphate kinase 1 [Candidatus Sulfotelmatobacter sp.]
VNPELSLLQFQHRVLEEARAACNPLLERVKFLTIVSSNLDEFFMVRVAGLVQQRVAGVRRRDPSGLTAVQQLERIGERAHRLVAEQSAGIAKALAQLKGKGLSILEPADWSADQRAFLRSHFAAELLPTLTPLGVQALDPAPLLAGLQLHVGVVLGAPGAERPWQIVAVPLPGQPSRFVAVPGGSGVSLARLEDVVTAGLDLLFPGADVQGAGVFRLTRDADVAIHDDEGGDLVQTVEAAVLARRRRAAVRLEIGASADPRLRQWLPEWLGLQPEAVYEIPGMLDATGLMELVGRRDLSGLALPEWPPQPPQDLVGAEDLWATLQDRDVLLFHPYESFEPVVQLLSLAAEDPTVLAIKQTLYRTSGDSPIVGALERAGRAGKQVTVLVELRARFDEARNVGWARRLEDAGCHVLYGVAGLKTHAKALLIVRREADRIRRYVHLSTGNYNDRTARVYSDIGLLTSQPELAADVAAFFNLLTGASEAVGWSALTIAPTDLRERFVELIDREIEASTPDQPGLIMAKVNSLEDPGICKALYRASRAGVRVRLNVRGICCLRPAVKGISENIEVRSIVDRYLEHARVFYFRNGGHEDVYLSSADWMGRNLDRRLELLFPVTAPPLVRRLIGILEIFFADTVKARRLSPDGTYERVPAGRPPVRAQERFYQDAVEAARAAKAGATRFRPLTRPEE